MENLANKLAIRMMDAKSIDELRVLWQEVNKGKFTQTWMDWLTDIKNGNKIRLEPDEEPKWLTKEGATWWKS
jgi:hypothetical protein